MYTIKKVFYRVLRYTYLLRTRAKNRNTDFTLISQNCIGGVIYKNLGLEFKSPTIGMFIEGENFIKLVQNFKYYMSIKAVPLNDEYIDPIDSSIHYPKIAVGDLEICCLHYKNCEDAIDAWERRRKRINYDKIYVLGNSWNMHSDELLVKKLFEVSPYKTAVFVTKECNCEGAILLPGDYWHLDNRGIVRPNITDNMPRGFHKYFETFFDYVSWLN